MRILIIATVLLLAACSGKETPPDGSQHADAGRASAVAATAIPPARRQNHYLGVGSLGIPFKELLSHFDYDSTKEQDGYLWVYKNGEVLFGLSDKNDLHDQVAWMIFILSPSIVTDGDVHVGMPVPQLLKIFPGMSLDMTEEDGEAFSPSGFGTSAPADASAFFVVAKKDGSSLSQANPVTYPTKEFSTDGVVRKIVVYVSGNRPIGK